MRMIPPTIYLLAFVRTVVADADESEASAPELLNTNSYFWQMSSGETESAAGFSWYTKVFELFQEGHPVNMQMGMGGTWLNGLGISFDVCACNPAGWPSSPDVAPGDPSNGCCDKEEKCGWLFQTFEGGPGYWMGELPTTLPKWRIGSTTGCYRTCMNSPLWCGSGPPKDCDELGIVALSNRMLVAPDGVVLSETGMLGVSYVRTPFGKVNASDSRNFWTVVLDAENFGGPIAHFLPEYWATRAEGFEEESAHLMDIGTAPGLTMGSDAFEWNTMQTYKDSSGYRLPKIAIPYRNDRGVLMMGHKSYENADVFDVLEAALSAGSLDPAKVMSRGGRANCREGSSEARVNVDGGSSIGVGTLKTTIEDGECVWAVDVENSDCAGSSSCPLPQYLSPQMHPLDGSQVSAALREQEFPEKQGGRAYDALNHPPAGGCAASPGPASSTLYCAQTRSPSWLAWRWYRFVDQPSMHRAKLSSHEEAFVQKRIETMHKMLDSESHWIKGRGASQEGLATIDPSQFVTPPAGMEFGYVPVVLYEGLDKPQDCVVPDPSPVPTPPSPTPPSPTPPSPTPPSPQPGVWIYEADGSGKAFLTESAFLVNSHRGGALAWDVCAGAAFDNGRPVWTSAEGSRIGAVAASGATTFRTAQDCARSFPYPDLVLSKEFSAADGRRSVAGLGYLELASSGVWIYEKDGSGKVFLGEGAFKANSHRGGALAWDVCAGAAFDTGRPLWTAEEGSRVGAVAASGALAFRSAQGCARSFSYPDLVLGKEFSAADGRQTVAGLGYLEVSTTVEI